MISIPENHPEKVAILRLLVLYDARYSGRESYTPKLTSSPEHRCSAWVAPILISLPCLDFPDVPPTAREGYDNSSGNASRPYPIHLRKGSALHLIRFRRVIER